MDKAHKALFNSIRMSYLQDPTLPYDPWKVEDLHAEDMRALFSRLQDKKIYLDKTSFLTYSEPFDSPEEFMEWLVDDAGIDAEDADSVYLTIFELWRRLAPEKVSISIFADELDWLIYAYENNTLDRQNLLETAIENLYEILQENVDEGMEPQEAFSAICEFFANDLEAFLYTFIGMQLDQKDYVYAKELIDQFYPFIIDPIWFLCLQARLIAHEDIGRANTLIRQIFEQSKQEQTLDLNFDLLDMMVHSGDHALFLEIFDYTLSLIDNEDDFIELLTLARDYFCCLDQDAIMDKLDAIIAARAANSTSYFTQDDPDLETVRRIIGIGIAK